MTMPRRKPQNLGDAGHVSALRLAAKSEQTALYQYVAKVALGMSRSQQFGGQDECIEAAEVRQVLYLRSRYDGRLRNALRANGGEQKVLPHVLSGLGWAEDTEGLWWPPRGAA